MRDRLALHTWTLDTTSLAEIVRIAGPAGWNALELRRVDFERAAEAGHAADHVLDLARNSGLPVACVGVKLGWMFAEGTERGQLLQIFAESCRWAAVLGAGLVMSPVDVTEGPVRRAVASLREVGDIAREHGVRLALELGSQAPQFNTLERTREVVVGAGHPSCGLLVDAYHIQRSGGLQALEALPPEEIFYFQYSDVPRQTRPGFALDRLPPGQGVVPFREVFGILAAKGYEGYLSYEAPNPAAWSRDPAAVAREASEATRALLPPR
jgi:2-keto-myo-inositol isomerase